MSQFSGIIGIKQDDIETSPGIYTTNIEEIPVRGRLDRQNVKSRDGELTQGTLSLNHILSFVASEHIINKIYKISYIVWMDKKWTVSNIEIQHPRINLTIGGLYNE